MCLYSIDNYHCYTVIIIIIYFATTKWHVVILAGEEWRYPATTDKLLSFTCCTVGEFSFCY